MVAGSSYLQAHDSQSQLKSRYHPVEGEALAVAYALHKTWYYIQGCKQLIVATDHRPLLKIFGDRNLEDISKSRLLNFKEKALQYKFEMVYVPGKEHDGPNSMSRYPVSALPSRLDDAVLSTRRVLDEETEKSRSCHNYTNVSDQPNPSSVHRMSGTRNCKRSHPTEN